MELLPQCFVFLREGCQLLGNPGELLRDGDHPSNEQGEEGEGRGLGGDQS